MTPNFVFNGRSYRKNLTKTNVTYYKCFNCDRGEHYWEANRLVIQIPATNLSSESFVYTPIFEKASQLNLYPNQIFLDLLTTMRDQFVNTPYSIPSKNQRTATFNRNEFDLSIPASSIMSSSKQPTFFSLLLGWRYS
ncbi:hypothetical protein HZS_1782 [Henneguya salminicola]|nr:hypothetical protein HZS_1782 [Henneguya salminicola]